VLAKSAKCDVDISTLEPSAATQCSQRSPTGTTPASISWDYLYWLARTAIALWRQYLDASQRPGERERAQRLSSSGRNQNS